MELRQGVRWQIEYHLRWQQHEASFCLSQLKRRFQVQYLQLRNHDSHQAQQEISFLHLDEQLQLITAVFWTSRLGITKAIVEVLEVDLKLAKAARGATIEVVAIDSLVGRAYPIVASSSTIMGCLEAQYREFLLASRAYSWVAYQCSQHLEHHQGVLTKVAYLEHSPSLLQTSMADLLFASFAGASIDLDFARVAIKKRGKPIATRLNSLQIVVGSQQSRGKPSSLFVLLQSHQVLLSFS